MKLLIIKTLYIPNKYYVKPNLKSIQSLDRLDKTDIYISGYVKVQVNIKTKHNIIHLSKLDTNYGKAFILNQSSIFIKNLQYDYILYLDHDIILVNNLLKRICLPDRFGLIAPNHLSDNRHRLYSKVLNMLHITDKIASGCFIIRFKLFNFNLPEKVYYDDDSLIMKYINANNYLTGILLNVYVIHPFNYKI